LCAHHEPLNPSNQQLEDGEQPNPDSSKVTSDPKSEGKHKRKKDKTRDETDDTEELDDQIAADPDPSEDTSVVADQTPSKKSRRPGWKGVELQSTIISLRRKVDTLKAALEKAQRIRKKDPSIPTASSSEEEENAFDNNVDPMDNQSTPTVGRKQPPPTTPSTSVLGVGARKK